MRKLILMASMLAAVLLAASPALAQSGVQGPACAELGDGDSGEQAQQEAQIILDQDPSDPNGLDADGDGTPCEFTESPGEISYEDGSVIFVTKAAPPQNNDAPGDQYSDEPDSDQYGDEPTGDQYGDEPDGDQYGDEPTGDEPTGDQPTGDQSTPEEDVTPEESGIPVLPDTGGASLLTLGVGVLLVAGGLLARRIVR